MDRVNKKYLISSKVLYLVMSMQFYVLHQFRSLFAKEVFDIKDSEIGLTMGFIYFVTFFTNLAIAAFNDRFNRPKSLLIFLILSSALSFRLFYIEYFVKIGKPTLIVVMFLYMMTNTPIMSILDKITLEYLSGIEGIGPRTYGRQRMFGTIGYLIMNLAVEILIKPKDPSAKYNFGILKAFHIVTTSISVITAFCLIKSNSNVNTAQGIRKGFMGLLKNFHYMFFITIILLNGICRASMTNYLSVFFKNYLILKPCNIESLPSPIKYPLSIFNKNPLFTCSSMGVFLEIIIFFFSEKITFFLGLYWPLLLSQVAALLRFIAYYYLRPVNSHTFAFSCLIELLKGLNFGFTHIVGVQLASILCPIEIKATSQMFYNGTFVGLASMLSGIIFSQIFKDVTMDSNKISSAEKDAVYSKFYITNIILTLVSIVAFLIKYGFIDGVLFSKKPSESASKKTIEKNEDCISLEGKTLRNARATRSVNKRS